MADDQEDKSSKTEEPTEKKIRDAVDKGQTPFSKELPALFTLTAMAAIIGFGASELTARLRFQFEVLLDQSSQFSLATHADAMLAMDRYWQVGAVILAPMMIALMVAGLAGSVLQNPPRLVLKRIQPQWSRISLRKGLERMFGAKGLAEFFKVLAKIGFTGACVAFFAGGTLPILAEGPMTASSIFLQQIADIMFGILFTMVLAMTLIAVADLLWTNKEWLKDLRMSQKEIKDEHKQAEGDPLMKARMQSVARERVRRRMMSAVPTATLVLTNPTHYAIALRYTPPDDAAPVVVAKGQDLMAQRIKALAESHHVTLHENPPLTRAMYKAVAVDQQIPRQFFEAVAEIIVQINKKKR